jgi:hypothetical protein
METHSDPDIDLTPQELDCLRTLEVLDLLDQLQDKQNVSLSQLASDSIAQKSDQSHHPMDPNQILFSLNKLLP